MFGEERIDHRFDRLLPLVRKFQALLAQHRPLSRSVICQHRIAMFVRIFDQHEVELLDGGIITSAENDQRPATSAFGSRVIHGVQVMALAIGHLDPLIDDTQRIEPRVERLNVLGRRHRPLGVIRRKEKFRRPIVVVRAQQRAALGDPVGGCRRQTRDPIGPVRPGAKPPLRIACADLLDRLQDLGGVSAVRCHVVHRPESLKVIGLIGEKSAVADILSMQDGICNRTDNEHARDGQR